jgi:hypothetical protein
MGIKHNLFSDFQRIISYVLTGKVNHSCKYPLSEKCNCDFVCKDKNKIVLCGPNAFHNLDSVLELCLSPLPSFLFLEDKETDSGFIRTDLQSLMRWGKPGNVDETVITSLNHGS